MQPEVVVIDDATVARGGTTALALLEAEQMAARGIRVTYVCGDDGDNPALVAAGVDVRPLGGKHLLNLPAHVAAARGLYNRAARDHVAAIVAELDGPQTVYHVHGFSKTLSPALFAALRPVRSRSFLHAHDYFLACPNGGYMDYQAMLPCSRNPLSMSCLTTSCDKRSYAQKLWRSTRGAILWRVLDRNAPWGGVLLIHPGMVPGFTRGGYPAHRLIALRNPATAFSATRIAAEANRGFVFVGRVEAEKGIEDLILAAERTASPLTVIGDGPLRESLEAANPAVRFTGWMDRGQIAAEIASARALVMPSRYPEPFGLVVAEAVLSGLPVILSDTALLGPEVAAQGLGLVCDTRDPAVFAATLRQMESLPAADVEAMSRRGHAGGGGVSTTARAWVDSLLDLFARTIAP